MALAIAVGILIGGGVLLVLRRGMLRLVVGFVLLGHGANLLIITSGGAFRRGPAQDANPDPILTSDPLPQAFVLTAIVIAFAITVYMLVLSVVGDEDDDTEIPIEGREDEHPDLYDEDDEGAHTFGDGELRYLDPTDRSDYERRMRAGHGHLEQRHSWSEEDW
ncbi:MAG: cation:proton antiporter subunit C [Mobilicoccus sp.]|nr:cation:proton antiporter subunit C [Mobilicoccus sp.]